MPTFVARPTSAYLWALFSLALWPVTAVAGSYGLPDDRISLRSAHGGFVVAEADGAARANRDTALAWETFEVIDNRDGTVSLRTDHNTFLVAEADGTADSDRTAIGAWEKFTVERHPDGQFSFRTAHGTYLVAEVDGELNADRTQVGPWEKFQARSATNGRNVTLVDYARNGARVGRFFQIDDATWVEENPGNRFTFEEIGRDAWSVYLLDATRGAYVQLDLYLNRIFLSGDRFQNKTEIYTIDQATSKLTAWLVTDVHFSGFPGQTAAGLFRNVGGTNWLEEGSVPNRTRFAFTEVQRDDWSIYLEDRGRNVSIQLDLYRKEVRYAPIGGQRQPLYAISYARHVPFRPDPGVIELPGTGEKLTVPQLRQQLAKSGLTLVQSDTLKPGQCAIVYPRADEKDVAAEFGLLTCAVKLDDNVTLTSVAVFGGCDASDLSQGVGAACEVGVGSQKVTIDHDGAQSEFNITGPSANACGSVSTERLCLNGGATVASTAFTVTDKNSNGIGIGLEAGVGAGLSGGYEDGVLSGSVNLKFIVGGSITFSVNAEDAGNLLMDGGQTGLVIVGKEVVGASDAMLEFYHSELGPGLESTSGEIVMVAEQGGRAVVDFSEKTGQDIGNAFDTATQDISRGAGQAASDVGNGVISVVEKISFW